MKFYSVADEVTTFFFCNTCRSDVEEGGETVFPASIGNFSAVPGWNEMSACAKRGLAVKPKMGDALLFWSMRPDATLDPSSLHGKHASSTRFPTHSFSPHPFFPSMPWLRETLCANMVSKSQLANKMSILCSCQLEKAKCGIRENWISNFTLMQVVAPLSEVTSGHLLSGCTSRNTKSRFIS